MRQVLRAITVIFALATVASAGYYFCLRVSAAPRLHTHDIWVVTMCCVVGSIAAGALLRVISQN